MKKSPSSITLEEAVAYMVNMDYIPAGLTLLEMLDAFSQEAEFEYNNDRGNWTLQHRMESCISRYNLASLLLESLQHEVDHPDDSIIVLADETSSKQHVTFDSVSDWAAYKYGIGITDWTQNTVKKKFSWKDVTIKINDGDKTIGYSIKGGRLKNKDLRETDFMGKKNNKPNRLYNILIGLSIGKSFSTGQQAQSGERKAIYDLRSALKNLVGLTDEPFLSRNPYDGWKPKFELKSDLADTKEYPEKYNFHISYDDSGYGNNHDDDTYEDDYE